MMNLLTAILVWIIVYIVLQAIAAIASALLLTVIVFLCFNCRDGKPLEGKRKDVYNVIEAFIKQGFRVVGLIASIWLVYTAYKS